MSISLQFYADQNLTQPLSTTQVTIDREIGGAVVDKVFYLGSPSTGRTFTADDGGPIIVSVLDAEPTTGFAATDIRLAATQVALSNATPGAEFTINGSITGGANNAVPVWLRFSGVSSQPQTSDDIALSTNLIREYAN